MSEPWPVEPMDPEERAGLREAVATFLQGLGGGVLTLVGLCLLAPAAPMRTHGASRSWVLEKQRRERCAQAELQRALAEEPPADAAGER